MKDVFLVENLSRLNKKNENKIYSLHGAKFVHSSSNVPIREGGLHLSWDFLYQYEHVKAGVSVLDNLCWAIPLKSHGSTYNYIVQTIKTFNNYKRARATGNDTGKTRVNVRKNLKDSVQSH